MKKVIVIGCGISGLSCAVTLSELQTEVTLVSPYHAERCQSVMAAGGINAVQNTKGEGDSIETHIADTEKGGCYIASQTAIRGLCNAAPEIVSWLSTLGTVFSRDKNGAPDVRAFGGQSCRRTVYAGASTGKQIVTALNKKVREYRCKGTLTQRYHLWFHSLLTENGVCYGALFYNEMTGSLEPIYAGGVVMATGGLNGLFGKTTGSTLCDGYAAGRLLMQGVRLKNLEFIQYHPTTIETSHKRMLISEAARGEGGRLFYLQDGCRVYFMEDKYGPRGNLMPRDIVSRCIYEAPSQVYLDVSFLPKETINQKIPEIRDVCKKYIGLDISKEPIPVSPSVHFFMGGIDVNLRHETNIRRLYAVGECASMYHGANRLGGNSLLAAVYSGRVAAKALSEAAAESEHPDFEEFIAAQAADFSARKASASQYPTVYVERDTAKIMAESLGIIRNEQQLKEGIEGIDFYRNAVKSISFDSRIKPHHSYAAESCLTLDGAILRCALARKETRGAQIRSDYPETLDEYRCATYVTFENGAYHVTFGKEPEA